MLPDLQSCFRVLAARDRRFDGLLYVGVTTTGVYCRPVCPARTPRPDRCRFFRLPAEAERAGFRPCFRCRPELAPGQASVDALSRMVAAALKRIDAGALNDGDVEALAGELGVTARHLRRAMRSELGVSPIELGQTRRLLLAKQLITETSLSMTEIAFASGFASVRRFNALFRARYRSSPTALRRRAHADGGPDGALALRLEYQPPFAWRELIGFLAARAISGVDEVEGEVYRRSVRLGDRAGWLAVAPAPGRLGGGGLDVTLAPALAPVLLPLLSRLRRLFDLDARPALIAAHLGQAPELEPLVARTPGLRVPGAFDGFEMAVRAVLGQQVSVRAATTLAGRIAAALGEPVTTPYPGLTRLMPGPARVAAAGPEALAQLGVLPARARTIVALASAMAEGRLCLDPGADPDATIASLEALPGVGPWTAQYVAMRALGWPDAFPAEDLGLRKALGDRPPRAIRAAAEAWRPWRAYAAMHLWHSLA